jgi:serine/threonine protein phosphatase PrpC
MQTDDRAVAGGGGGGQARSALLAVFDGHGGDFVSRTAEHLLPVVFEQTCHARCPSDPPAALQQVPPHRFCRGQKEQRFVDTRVLSLQLQRAWILDSIHSTHASRRC